MKSLFPIHCLLDIESSGLSDHSYPIEIAWYKPNDNTYDSFLIAPAPSWTEWDDLAEELFHGISRLQLIEQGIEPQAAAVRLNRSLSGKRVFVDGFAWDSFWLKRLFDQAEMDCEFRLAPLTSEIPQYTRPHRALPDVMATFAAWKSFYERS